MARIAALVLAFWSIVIGAAPAAAAVSFVDSPRAFPATESVEWAQLGTSTIRSFPVPAVSSEGTLVTVDAATGPQTTFTVEQPRGSTGSPTLTSRSFTDPTSGVPGERVARITIRFPTPVTAVGADVLLSGTVRGPGIMTGTVRVFDAAGVLLGSRTPVSAGPAVFSQFVGVVADAPVIARFEVEALVGGTAAAATASVGPLSIGTPSNLTISSEIATVQEAVALLDGKVDALTAGVKFDLDVVKQRLKIIEAKLQELLLVLGAPVTPTQP